MLEFRLMSRTHYVIRPMAYEDVPQVAQIDKEAFPGECMFRSLSSYKREIDNPSVRYIVACKKSEAPGCEGQAIEKLPWFKRIFSFEHHIDGPEDIVGFSGFWMMMKSAHITAIAVRESHRGLGLGETLLIAIIELAQILNADVVTLEVRASNAIAQGLYKKHGFQPVGRRLKYYSSDGEDAIIMSTEDHITSVPFQASFQQLKAAHSQRHRDILARFP